jgi:DNA replication protein DnaC
METQIPELVKNALTEALAPQTKALPVNTQDWADWLKIQTHNDPEIENMVRKCAEFALAFKAGKTPRWITLLGVTGTGKTHCARRLWKHLSDRLDWRSAEFVQSEIYWPKFVSELRSGNAFDKFRDLWQWPAILVDDIGADRDTTGFATDQLNTLLGSRGDKWTIITSNLTLEQLGKVEPRIADRIIRPPNIFLEIRTRSHALRSAEIP